MNKSARNSFIALSLLMLASGAALAQNVAPQPAASPSPATPNNASQPIEITATKTVEWLRGQKQYVAREDVIVTQGQMTIKTDLLTADYREGAQSSTEIWQLTAEGNVQISDQKNTAYGDKGIYDVPTGVATLTGQNLRLVSPDQTVTAKDRMEYHSNARMAKAIGSAEVVRAQDTLSADTITAFFKDESAPASAPAPAAAKNPETGPLSGNGASGLDRLEADGHVVIVTPTEKLYGNRGIYRAASNTAELIGKVRIEKGENILEGERAEVNLTTNISKMYGSDKAGGRVRGVFFPGSEKKDGGTAKSPAPAPFKPANQTAPQPVPAQPAPAPIAAPAAPEMFPSQNTGSLAAPADASLAPRTTE